MSYNESKFRAAVDRHLALVERLGQDHKDTIKAMQVALELAPPEIQDQLTAKVKELELIPKTPYGLVDGEPVYRLEDIAKCLDITMEEAKAAVEEMLAEREALGLSNEVITINSPIDVLH
jgi:hypothetical protein